MPTYSFKNTETEEIIEKRMKISEMEEFIKSGEWKVYHGAVGPDGKVETSHIVSAVNEFGSHTSRAMAKHAGFGEVMRTMKKNHPYMKFKD